MARTLTSPLQTEVGRTITRPVYLVYIGLTVPVRYNTTKADIIWDTFTWGPQDIVVSNMNADKNSCLMKIQNTDLVVGASILSGNYDDKVVAVYKYYNGEAVQLIDGVISTSKVSTRWGELSVIDAGASYSQAPRIQFSDELFQSLPQHGTVVHWGSETFVIERSEF